MKRKELTPDPLLLDTDPFYDVVSLLYFVKDKHRNNQAIDVLWTKLQLFKIKSSLIYNKGLSDEAANEIIDKSFDALLKHIYSGRIFFVNSVKAYFIGIVKLQTNNYRRKLINKEIIKDPTDLVITIDPSDPYKALEDDQLIKNNIRRLTPRQQECLYYFLQDIPYFQMSRFMGVRESTCRSLLSRSIIRMRQLKKQEGLI